MSRLFTTPWQRMLGISSTLTPRLARAQTIRNTIQNIQLQLSTTKPGLIHSWHYTHGSLSQLKLLDYISQYNHRNYSGKSKDDYDSGQKAYDWKRSLFVTDKLYGVLSSNPQYCNTVYKPGHTIDKQVGSVTRKGPLVS